MPPVLWFIIRRIVAAVGLLLLLSFGVFALTYLAPGNAVDALLGLRPRSPDLVAQLKAHYHLDKPLLTQYWLWLEGVFHLNLGQSAALGVPVTTAISQRAGVTVFLGLYCFLMTMFIAIPLGIAAAVRQRGAVDRGVVAGSIFGMSAPAYVTGIILLWVFTVRWRLMPSFGPGSGFLDRVDHSTLPAIAFALTVAAPIVKLTRASMIEVLDQDYVSFARARGLPRWAVLSRYALRNACIPLVTSSTLLLAGLLVGAVFVEATFALPGLGSLLVQAVGARDLPLIQALALLGAATVLLANLVADVLYVIIDPRIRFGAVSA